jgi:peptide/nickel transport system substrate-binding protein
VLWKLTDPQSVLTGIGVPAKFRTDNCKAFFLCDAPLSSDAGALIGLDIEGAKKALKETSYAGQPVVMLEVANSISQTASRVLAQNMRAAGFTVEQKPSDWPTVLARRAKKDGWSMFSVYSNGTDMFSPLTHFYTAATCQDFPGWSCDDKIPGLMKAFTTATSDADRKKIAADIQVAAYQLTPAVMWGQFTIPAGYSTKLKGLIQSAYPMFWEVTL